MKDLITSSHRHLLWKDEVGDTFLLFDYGEVYKYSETVLVVICFTFEKARKVRKLGILYEFKTDDPLWIFRVKIDKLSQLLELSKFKQRPHLKGRWLKSKQELLGHKIIPFRPQKLYPSTS